MKHDGIEARIRRLERLRCGLQSAAGGAQFAANRYREFLDGRRQPSSQPTALADCEGADLVERYRKARHLR